MEDKILGLPLHLQIALGSGYLAYLVSYAGIRQHHTPVEVSFRSIAFGMAATAVMLWAPEAPSILANWKHPFWRPATAVLVTIAVGAFWRWRGMRWSRAILRQLNVSWSDDIPNAWLSVTATHTDTYPSQISVDLENGRTLMCENTRDFADAPHGPCVLGLDGSIALYVTCERRPDGTWLDHDDVRHDSEGDRLTYVPASTVKRVEFRLWVKPNGKGAQAAAEDLDAEATKAAS